MLRKLTQLVALLFAVVSTVHLLTPQASWGERGWTALGTVFTDGKAVCEWAKDGGGRVAEWWSPTPSPLAVRLAESIRNPAYNWHAGSETEARLLSRDGKEGLLRVWTPTDLKSVTVYDLSGKLTEHTIAGLENAVLIRNAIRDRYEPSRRALQDNVNAMLVQSHEIEVRVKDPITGKWVRKEKNRDEEIIDQLAKQQAQEKP